MDIHLTAEEIELISDWYITADLEGLSNVYENDGVGVKLLKKLGVSLGPTDERCRPAEFENFEDPGGR